MAYSQVQLLAYSHLCTELQAQFLSGLACFRKNPTPMGGSPGYWPSETALRYGGHLLRNRRKLLSKLAMYQTGLFPRCHYWPIPSYVLNFRLNFKVVMVVLGEILPQWEVALVSGYQKLQSDMGVTY